jgi:hypothetical protein
VAVIFTWNNDLVHVLFHTGLELRGDCEVCSNLCDPKIELEGRELKLRFSFYLFLIVSLLISNKKVWCALAFEGVQEAMRAIFLRRNLVMNLVFWVILALSALRSGDADGCTSAYDNGPYTVQNVPLTVPVAQSLRFLWIAVPTVEGDVEGKFPVVQFQHGFLIMNTCYSQIISHIASYGFIVVAPQVKFLGIF